MSRVKAINETMDQAVSQVDGAIQSAASGVGDAVATYMGFSPPIDRDEIIYKLRQEFEDTQLRTRDGGRNQKLVYVDRYHAVNRVIDATGNYFDMTIGDPQFLPLKDRDGNERTVCAIKVSVFIPGLGYREGLGVQDLRDGSGEDLIKGAIADGFKVAMSYFGLALELYNPDNPQLTRIKERDGVARQGVQRQGFGTQRARGF